MMRGKPGDPKPVFRQGQVLTAQEMNRLAQLIVRRIVAGKGISVKAFGDRIIIESTDQRSPS